MSPASTVIPFVKASACGNDFLIIDGMHAPADIASFSRRICDRHAGVGAIRTGAGIKKCTLISHNEAQYEFEIAMGEPQVGDEFSIKLAFGEVRGIPVSMGNPHYVVFVNEFGPGWQAEAAEIGRHHDFKHGINVELVNIKDKQNIEARFFERGVGETQSSGTGSCASAVAAITAKRAASPVRVHTPGGVQTVRWEGEVFLRGKAQLICRGEFFV